MVKLHEQANLWQLVLSVASLLIIIVASAFSVTEQVTRNEEKVIVVKEELKDLQSRQMISEDKIQQKLDEILREIRDTRIELEKKADR